MDTVVSIFCVRAKEHDSVLIKLEKEYVIQIFIGLM